MSNQNNSAATKNLLEELYKNIKMGANSIVDLMPKVADTALREELTAELECYEKFAGRIRTQLLDLGEEAKDDNFLAKMGAKMGMVMNTMTDTSTARLAELMIQGATMGITDTTRLVRSHENTSCSEQALALARETIKYEEETIERLKKFL